MIAGRRAADLVEDGMWVGLGTGSTTAHFLQALGERVAAGLRIQGVPTSLATEQRARQLNIPIESFESRPVLDLAVDGADEIDASFRMIKGGGGALMREKVVASAAERFIVIIDSSKQVETLGSFPLPIEVLPFAWPVVKRRVEALGVEPSLRRDAGGDPFVTDQGSFILDCPFEEIADPQATKAFLDDIPGLLEHGLFLDEADLLLVGRGDDVEELSRPT